jgi:ribosome-associated heat shock protein Hsp15
LSESERFSPPLSRRLDQWLWFARLVKSRSLAGRLCAAEAVTLNGVVVRKPNHMVRIGDAIAAPQGAYRHTVRIVALGSRRGPATEARMLYDVIGAPIRLADLTPAWEPLLPQESDGEAPRPQHREGADRAGSGGRHPATQVPAGARTDRR